MESRITRQPLGITIALFSLLLLFFQLRHLIAPMPEEAAVGNLTPFGGVICGWLDGLPLVEASLSVALILLTAVIITRVISRNLVFSSRTYVFLVFFAVIGYGVFIRSGNLPAVLAALLIARGSENLMNAFRRSAHMSETFRAGLLFGLAPLFYAPAAVYLPVSLIAMPVFMRGGRETIATLAGLVFPMTAWSYAAWIGGDPFTQYFTGLYGNLMAPGAGFPPFDSVSIASVFSAPTAVDIARIALLSLLVAGVVMSVGTYLIHARTMRTRAFRIYQYMIFLMFAGIGGMFLPCASIGDLPLISVGFSVIAAKYFSHYTGLVPALIYVLTIIAAVAYNLIFMI